MTVPDQCPACIEGSLSPWSKGLLTRRCVTCGYQEDRPVEAVAKPAPAPPLVTGVVIK